MGPLPLTKVDCLTVPGATLHVETTGSGPPLLLVCDALLDAGSYSDLAAHLADRYTVITYDPRGYSRSAIDRDAVDLSIDAHGADAAHILAAMCAEPANIVGCGTGALIALSLLTHHPERVHTAVVHEPPLVELLPNRQHWREFLHRVHATYRAKGAAVAMAQFMSAAELGPAVAALPRAPDFTRLDFDTLEQVARIQGNQDLFFADQLPSLIGYLPDVDTLTSSARKIVLSLGRESTGLAAHTATLALATLIGTEPVELSGNHQGFATDPGSWAEALHKVFRG